MSLTTDILQGDALEMLRTLPEESHQCVVTSPPYWGLRDYGCDGQIGLEKTPEEFIARLVEVFREVRRVLRDDGTLWVNMGDCYNAYNGAAGPSSKLSKRQSSERPKLESGYGLRFAGLKPKDLIGVPWRLAFALQADGWYLRQDIIWSKPNPMPESVTDRCTKAHEYIFLLSKNARYFYDQEAIKEESVDAESINGRNPRNGDAFTHSDPNGLARTRVGFSKLEGVCYPTRNKRTVWNVPTASCSDAHFATFPPDLIKPCILAGTRAGDRVLDPFGGSGTTGMVALELGRNATLIELNPEYVELIKQRTNVTPGLPL